MGVHYNTFGQRPAYHEQEKDVSATIRFGRRIRRTILEPSVVNFFIMIEIHRRGAKSYDFLTRSPFVDSLFKGNVNVTELQKQNL